MWMTSKRRWLGMLDFFHVVLCIVLLVSSTLWGMWIILGSKQCDEPFVGRVFLDE